MKLKLLLALMIVTQISYGQSLFTKAIGKLAKAIAPPVSSTATLLDIVPSGGIASNLHPAEVGTISQSFFKGWKPGGDQIGIGFSKISSSGFYKIDGTVTVDGVPAEYVTAGTYSIITDANPAPRKVEIVTSTGEKASFTIAPNKNKIKILTINGQTDNISLDLTKDVVVELETQLPANTMIKVGLAINQVSIKSIYDVCFLRSGSKITIPAAAFRNMNIVPGGGALYNYKKSFLSVGVESLEQTTDVSGGLSSFQYTSSYSDGKLVNVTNEPDLNKGLTVKGNEERMDYTCFKPNAFMSRPFSEIKKIGVISFSIRGTTYKEHTTSHTSSNTLNMGGISNTTTTTTTTTTILEFPKQTNEVWDGLLEKLYPEFMAVVKSEFGADDILVDYVTSREAYKFTKAFAKDDENTTVEFARSYRNTKVLSAFMPMSEGYGVNSVNERIMKEAGADALMTMTLDLEISHTKDKEVIMIPKFAYEIVGKTNGSFNTKYCTGNIKSITGVTFKKDITPAELEGIIRKSDMLVVFRKALKELKEKEAANPDYLTVWNLQK